MLGLTEQDRVFSTTKLFHAYGLGNNLTFPMSVGGTSVYSTGPPTPDKLLERVSTHSPSLYFSVPALYAAILTDTGGFRFSNTSPRCHAIAGQLLATGVEPEEMYRRVYASVPVGKLALLREAGIKVADSPAAIGQTMQDALRS